MANASKSSGMTRRAAWLLERLLFAGALLPGLVTPAQAQLNPGDIVVADFEAGGDEGRGLLFRVDRATGARTVLSDFKNLAQGQIGHSPYGVAVVDTNTILVVDSQGAGSGAGVLFVVNATTGVRTVLSDFGDSTQGPTGVEPVGIALGAGGILVTDTGGFISPGVLFRIHPLTGARTLLSDFGNPAQGPLGQSPTGVARGANGIILVIDPDGGTDVPNDGKTGGNGALFVVDSVTGARTVLSDFGNALQGPTGSKPGGVALGPGGAIYVVDTDAGTGANGVLFSVDPLTGMRTVLSNFGVAAQGPTGTDPVFLAVSATGHILVTDDDGGTDIPLDGHPGGNGALFSVDPTNGRRTLLSDFGNGLQGATGVNPVGVAIVPLINGGDALVVDFFAGTAGIGALFSVNPATGARTLLSDFGNPQQGPLGFNPVDVSLGPHGDILVVDQHRGGGLTPGALFRVNPVNGSRTLLSDFTQAALGFSAGQPHGVVLGPDGDILVVTSNGGSGSTPGRGTLIRVNPVTGARTLVSDFGNSAQGPLGFNPEGVAVSGPGEVLVLDIDALAPGGSVARGLLFRVSLATGTRTIVSNFSDIGQGRLGIDPPDVDVEPDGSILVVEAGTGSVADLGVLFRIDPVSGVRTVLSDFSNAAQGPIGRRPSGVAVDRSGGIFVIDIVAGPGNLGTLFRVHPTTGMRTVVSEFGLPGQGPLGARPLGVTMYPENALLSFCGDNVVDPGEQCDDGNAVSGDGCSATCSLEGAAGVNRYMCYATKQRKGSLLVFEIARGVTLADRIETLTVDVRRTENLCNPADVDGSGIADADAHLRTYTIAQVPRSPAFQRRMGVGVVTEFGNLTVDLIRRDDLMVPTGKSLTGSASPPSSDLDRYKCYGVRVVGPAPAPDVVVSDEFGQPKTYEVGRATRLCLPVSKNGDDIENPLVDLMCFGIRPALRQPRHVPVKTITARDEFWSDQLESVRETELCVPAQTTGLP